MYSYIKYRLKWKVNFSQEKNISYYKLHED